MDGVPDVAELGVIELVAGNRLGAVIDEENEARGQNPEAEMRNTKRIMAGRHKSSKADRRRAGLLRRGAGFNRADRDRSGVAFPDICDVRASAWFSAASPATGLPRAL